MDDARESRRQFLVSGGAAFTSAWLVANWPGIAAAAEHAAHVVPTSAPATLGFFSASEAADVEAITAQILPSGETPGAREAHAVYFIDRALATFFGERAAGFRTGLADFQLACKRAHPAAESFAVASPSEQLAFLGSVDRTPFFEAVRMLTILGTLTASRYGGNHEGLGWKLMGFEDQHIFEPPFGGYEQDYAGFVPYTKERAS
jgi:hypothetical protein